MFGSIGTNLDRSELILCMTFRPKTDLLQGLDQHFMAQIQPSARKSESGSVDR